MPVQAEAKLEGGRRLRRWLRQARKLKPYEVEVGFFADARYPPVRTGKNGGQKQEPLLVAEVAARNEFGTGGVPERPFFRNVIAELKQSNEVVQLVGRSVDLRTPRWLPTGQEAVAEHIVGQLWQSITDLDRPPNSPVTIARKGSPNPLIDTGFMRGSVSWRRRD